MTTETILKILVFLAFFFFIYTLYTFQKREITYGAKHLYQFDKKGSLLFDEDEQDGVENEFDRRNNRYKIKGRIGCLITIILVIIIVYLIATH